MNLFEKWNIGAAKKQEQAPDGPFDALSDDLMRGAQEAKNAKRPAGTTERMAGTVARTSMRSFQIAEGARARFDTQRLERLETAFYKGTKEACELYEDFPAGANKDPDYKIAYGTAHKKLAPINRRHLKDIGALLPTPMSGDAMQELVDRASFDDIVAVTASQLGVPKPAPRNIAEIKAILSDERIVRGSDSFRNELETLPSKDAQDAPFTEDEILAVDLSTRYANATWMATQAHRARIEKSTERIDRTQKTSADIFDRMKRNMYEETKREFNTDTAVYRVAFEIWKDVLQLRSPEKPLPQEGANYASDLVALRTRADGKTEVLLAQRRDGQWGLVGGKRDMIPGPDGTPVLEDPKIALVRELQEETLISGVTDVPEPFFEGKVEDDRAKGEPGALGAQWMETTAYKLDVTGKADMEPTLPDTGEVKAVAWVVVTPALYRTLYGSHGELLRRAVEGS